MYSFLLFQVLENRTAASRQEMDMLETLEELRELNSRHAKVDHQAMLKLNADYIKKQKQRQEEEDDELVRSVQGKILYSNYYKELKCWLI